LGFKNSYFVQKLVAPKNQILTTKFKHSKGSVIVHSNKRSKAYNYNFVFGDNLLYSFSNEYERVILFGYFHLLRNMRYCVDKVKKN
jgi:hypothetical protein